jgi:acyl-CoA synthetase (AMP-forming)/AMP-acid ligase II
MMGYYKDPDAIEEAGRHGWHHTGDIGRIDDDAKASRHAARNPLRCCARNSPSTT